MPPEPPDDEEPAEPKGSLQPRQEEDATTVAWLGTLAGLRGRALSVEAGPLVRHALSPEGDRFYYYREVTRTEAKDGAPEHVTYALHSVGPEKSEAKIADTGVDAYPPLFLGTDRMVFTSRRYDRNDDGRVDSADDAALIVSNRDGGNAKQAAILDDGEVPVAVWREGREVLLAVRGDDDVSGWIVSLNLVSGKRERIVEAFDVAMVLDGDKLLIERMQAPEPPRQPAGFGRSEPVEEKEEPPPEATLLDYVHFSVFDPADSSVTPLYKPARKAELLATGDGSYFGVQQRDSGGDPNMQRGPRRPSSGWEILIVDDAEHRDTRSPSARYDYEVLAWIDNRGLLLVERGNLGSRLMLMDRALKFHRIADFPLEARGFTASRNGLTVGWVEVEDTDKNGHLQPWSDHSRPHYLKIE